MIKKKILPEKHVPQAIFVMGKNALQA